MVTRFPISSVANDVISLRQAMDRMFNESLTTARTRTIWPATKPNRSHASIALDVYATDDEAVVLAAVPGVDPEQIDISIEKNTVTLKGEIANAFASAEAKDASWYLHELPYGSFQRSLTLPWEIDLEAADATFQHGLLRLTLPKARSAKPKQIRVRVEAAQPVAIEADHDAEAVDTSEPVGQEHDED
jgi:HSP20 family protein